MPRVDRYAVDLENHLLTAFRDQCRDSPQTRLHALLDLGLTSPDGRWLALVRQMGGQSLYEGIYAGADLEQAAPYLIPLPVDEAARQERVHRLLAKTQATAMLSFIAAPCDTPSLATLLQAHLEAESPQGEAFMLRMADTRCLASMREVFTPEQWQRLTSGMSHWWYANRGGALQVVECAGASTEFPREPFRLTEAQLTALTRAALPDQLLHMVQRHADRLGTLQITPSQAHDHLASAMTGQVDEDLPALSVLYRAAIVALMQAKAFDRAAD